MQQNTLYVRHDTTKTHKTCRIQVTQGVQVVGAPHVVDAIHAVAMKYKQHEMVILKGN